jgi:hypothetical protein
MVSPLIADVMRSLSRCDALSLSAEKWTVFQSDDVREI